MQLVQEDRFAIQDVLAKYCFLLDDRDWVAFAELFHPDATVDFSAFGGPTGDVPTLVTFLQQVAVQVPAWQHTTSTQLLEACDDGVRARTAAQVMMINRLSDGSDQVTFIGLWYRDLLVMTEQGWRIRERVQQFAWTHNMPQS